VAKCYTVCKSAEYVLDKNFKYKKLYALKPTCFLIPDYVCVDKVCSFSFTLYEDHVYFISI